MRYSLAEWKSKPRGNITATPFFPSLLVISCRRLRHSERRSSQKSPRHLPGICVLERGVACDDFPRQQTNAYFSPYFSITSFTDTYFTDMYFSDMYFSDTSFIDISFSDTLSHIGEALRPLERELCSSFAQPRCSDQGKPVSAETIQLPIQVVVRMRR